VTLADTAGPSGAQALLQPLLRDGRRVATAEPLAVIRKRVQDQLELLPVPLRRLSGQPAYPVEIDPALQRLAEAIDQVQAASG
jgi:nicotinate phosphoribosyltransferase